MQLREYKTGSTKDLNELIREHQRLVDQHNELVRILRALLRRNPLLLPGVAE